MSDNAASSASPRPLSPGLIAGLGRLLVRTLVAGIISLVLAIVLLRLLLPLAPRYHAQLEQWAGDALGVRVILSEVDA
ncbi:MAG: hypothetical protein AAFX85_20285, partial [Pseudomonadota bacterium]